MHYSQNNLVEIKDKIKSKIKDLQISEYNPKIIAVSKTFPEQDILPLLDYGHCDFGENKVQEAVDKWTDVKIANPNINLHMVGKLQTNKVKQAVRIFDSRLSSYIGVLYPFVRSLWPLFISKKLEDYFTNSKYDPRRGTDNTNI